MTLAGLAVILFSVTALIGCGPTKKGPGLPTSQGDSDGSTPLNNADFGQLQAGNKVWFKYGRRWVHDTVQPAGEKFSLYQGHILIPKDRIFESKPEQLTGMSLLGLADQESLWPDAIVPFKIESTPPPGTGSLLPV